MKNNIDHTIIIDTNQFFSDWSLQGARWQNLLKYMELTDATLLMPEIIWEEIGKNYINQVDSKIESIRKDIKKLQLDVQMHQVLINNPFERLECNEDLRAKYLAWLKKKLRLESRHFIATERKWFDNLVQRALNHKKPFSSDSDKGFKDCLIWLSVLGLAEKSGFKEAPIVFISANDKDFSLKTDGSRSKIHPDLEHEASKKGLEVTYFKSIDEFIGSIPNEVLHGQDLLKSKISKSYLASKILNKLNLELLKVHGLEVDVRQIHIEHLNYFIRANGVSSNVDISCSGYVDVGVSSTFLQEFLANLSIDQKDFDSIISIEIHFNKQKKQGWG